METYRIREDASVYFITCSVVDWLPVFISEAACRIVTDSFNFCHDTKSLRIHAYVIMPTHLHAVVFDADHDPQRLDATLTAFRKHTGRALADFTAAHLPQCFSTTLREAAEVDRSRRFWQPTRHPVALNSAEFLRQKVDYLHHNPCRKGLVRYPEDWRFSSGRFHAEGTDQDADVVITPLE